MKVGIGPGHIMLDGNPVPLPPKGHSPAVFGPCLLRPNGSMDQDATWYGGRPRSRLHCVRWGTQLPFSPQKSDTDSPIFGPCLLWPNGCPSQLLLSTCWDMQVDTQTDILTCSSQNIAYTADEVITTLLLLLVKLFPYMNLRLPARRTVDGSSWWFKCDWCVCSERAVSFIVERGLTNVDVGTAAATALLDVCNACSGRLTDQFDALTAQSLYAIKLPHRDAEVAINVLKGLLMSSRLTHSV